MAEDKVITGDSDKVEDDNIIRQCSDVDCNNVDNVVDERRWIECNIRKVIQSIQNEITELENECSQIDVKTSAAAAAAATLTARIEVLIRNRDIMQKNLDEFLTKHGDQHREDTLKGDKETMTDMKTKKDSDSVGPFASSGSIQEQERDMFDLKSDSSSEEEIEIHNTYVGEKLCGGESTVERLCKRIEEVFSCSDSDDDYPSQDPDLGIYTNIEGLADQLRETLLTSPEELMEGKVKVDDSDM